MPFLAHPSDNDFMTVMVMDDVLGEGDCDGPGDGGQHDGNAGCKGDLVCGSNNCRKFGLYYHEKDDCCEKPSDVKTSENIDPSPVQIFPGKRKNNIKDKVLFSYKREMHLIMLLKETQFSLNRKLIFIE